MSAAAAAGIAQFGMSFMQSQNQRSMGGYQQRMMDFNAKMAEKRADQIIEIGQKDSQKVRQAGKQILASQQVNFANQGVDINSGSALAIQQETMAVSADDARTVENNAYLEALGIRYEAINTRQQGRLAYIGANSEADQTLANGGLQAAMTYQQFKGKTSSSNEPMRLGRTYGPSKSGFHLMP